MVKQPKTVKQADIRLKSLKKQLTATEKLKKALAKKAKAATKKKPAKKKAVKRKATKRKPAKKKRR
ncbi:hypothetical protein CMI42_03570 [Candidatus Pacearchaeota archaeon]|nr:hypothetical protein [Candidatus Pacearchaeota archaeon]|tara:strand:- start:295 stop:492 length:198 start_codon:yes stop_codon:yes gene_type:complete